MTYHPKPPTKAANGPLFVPGFDRPNTPKLCKIEGCARNAKWEFELHLFPPAEHDPHRLHPWKMKVPDDFVVCDVHKGTMSAKQFLSEDGKREIAALAKRAGKPTPAWGRSRLVWSLIGESFPA
jgi:hypothetical protein